MYHNPLNWVKTGVAMFYVKTIVCGVAMKFLEITLILQLNYIFKDCSFARLFAKLQCRRQSI